MIRKRDRDIVQARQCKTSICVILFVDNESHFLTHPSTAKEGDFWAAAAAPTVAPALGHAAVCSRCEPGAALAVTLLRVLPRAAAVCFAHAHSAGWLQRPDAGVKTEGQNRLCAHARLRLCL